MGAQLFTFSKNETARVPLFTFSYFLVFLHVPRFPVSFELGWATVGTSPFLRFLHCAVGVMLSAQLAAQLFFICIFSFRLS